VRKDTVRCHVRKAEKSIRGPVDDDRPSPAGTAGLSSTGAGSEPSPSIAAVTVRSQVGWARRRGGPFDEFCDAAAHALGDSRMPVRIGRHYGLSRNPT